MVFSSLTFLLIFLPVTLVIYFIIPKKFITIKNIVLLIASLLFYSWGEPKAILIMIGSILVNYLFGILLSKFKKTGQRRAVLISAIIFNLALLFFFKYFNFATGNRFKYIALPIGISFYTFQIMSYVIDVYRKGCNAQYNFVKLALYISFFPQLIAGPIVRYTDIEKELTQRETKLDDVFYGAQRFILGLSKKVIISNCVAVIADQIFDKFQMQLSISGGVARLPMFVAWLGIIAYAIQLFFDFSGYSDMAIGLGRIFGFKFPENFNYPYAATSIQDFWRRWHITLSTWFREYVYIPLGGNRKGKARTIINLLIIFTLTGLWHGASWTFIVWGLYHGFFIVIERIGFKKVLDKLPKFVGRIYTIFVVLIGWVIFRSPDMAFAIRYIASLFNFTNPGWTNAFGIFNTDVGKYSLIILVLGIIFSFPLVPKIKKAIESKKYGLNVLTITSSILGLLLLVYAVMCLASSKYNPFIYFRF